MPSAPVVARDVLWPHTAPRTVGFGADHCDRGGRDAHGHHRGEHGRCLLVSCFGSQRPDHGPVPQPPWPVPGNTTRRTPLVDATAAATGAASAAEESARSLRKGARANGYATDLWTLDRVGAVIESVTGVAYHRGHVLARTLPSGLKVSEPTGTMPPLMKGWPRR